MDEVWKPIEGTNGRYEVSNTGKVRSNNYLGHGKVQELKSHQDKKGYLRTRIFKNNKRITLKIHRIAISEDGTETLFNSQAEAAEKLSVAQANIYKALNGQRKTAGGCRWIYADKRG